ncbi:MAG: pantoate--beta-alanine ligase [Candidatus Omnitrophica bacterium]|nr:pantoate--beta-alanine ligase [Candidatus Omnitrophota bacterium]
MIIIRGIKQMSAYSSKARLRGRCIGFVPTMGALHEGHLSLIRQAGKDNDLVLVSIFVNPAQFGPKEDLRKYPRTFIRDARLCKNSGVDVIFYPGIAQMYPEGYRTYVSVEGLSDCLCGRSRPGHFKGVATVVAKLFNIVQPDTAYFGVKDAQQSVMIRKMVQDLNIPVKIRVMPTVREGSGLALSSRNDYLSLNEKKDALILSRSLSFAEYLIKSGLKDADRVISAMKQLILKKRSAKIDYISIVDASTLRPLKKIAGECLIALAVRIGRTRLIDNVVVKVSLRKDNR